MYKTGTCTICMQFIWEYILIPNKKKNTNYSLTNPYKCAEAACTVKGQELVGIRQRFTKVFTNFEVNLIRMDGWIDGWMDGRMDKLEAQPAPFLCLPKRVSEEQNIYVFHFFMTGIIVCLTEYFKMNSGLKDYKNLFGGRNPLWYHVKWELLLGNPTTISHFTVHKQPHQLRVLAI